MRILMVHDESLDGGYGAESYVRRLVAGLRVAGDEVEVVAGERRHHGASKLLDPWDPVARRLVSERAAAFQPDVVHHHNIGRELSASVLTAASNVPAVMTVHDQRILGAREHPTRSIRGIAEVIGAEAISRTARRRLTATIAVSERLASLLMTAGFPDVTTIPVPALDPVEKLRPAQDCRDIAVVARLAPDKGIDHVIDAFTALGADAHGARLLIAGDGPERAALQRRARDLGERVSFLGRLGEAGVSSLLGRVRAVVVASVPGRRPEGSSLAVVEAATHGRPVIGSDDPAVQEVVERLGAGVIVPAGNSAALLVELRRLLADDGLVASIAAHSQEAAAAHTTRAVATATHEVYERVTRRRVVP
jgi:glycosyltransferase involved in cell wall biosynthesis